MRMFSPAWKEYTPSVVSLYTFGGWWYYFFEKVKERSWCTLVHVGRVWVRIPGSWGMQCMGGLWAHIHVWYKSFLIFVLGNLIAATVLINVAVGNWLSLNDHPLFSPCISSFVCCNSQPLLGKYSDLQSVLVSAHKSWYCVNPEGQ